MEKDIFLKEEMEEDMTLVVIYEVLDKFYQPHQHVYPKEIRVKMDDLLKSLGAFLNHEKEGYDVCEQKYFSKIRYKKQ